ncbi:MAG: toll/interleukin-1 receptor domain-containing protein [Chryseolinea sp.]
MSVDVNYDYLEQLVLIVWDEKANFEAEKTRHKIVAPLFKSVHRVDTLDEFKAALSKYPEDQLFLFVVHLFHNEDKKGVNSFVGARVKKEFPLLRAYILTSAPKRQAYEKDGMEDLDVFSYDGFHKRIGHELLPQKKSEIVAPSAIAVPSRSRLKKGIFLSHSSRDSKIVQKFRDLILESGLRCDPNDIKFTSVEDAGIPGGINIADNLREFLKQDTGLFIQFISKDYLESRVCLNEEGAAWCLLDDRYFISVLLPPSQSEDLPWVRNLNKALKLDNRGSILNLYQNRKAFFTEDVDVTKLATKVDEFIAYYLERYCAN